MSYIDEALRKAQKEKDHRYKPFGGIVAPAPKTTHRTHRRRILLGTAASMVTLLCAGLLFALYGPRLTGPSTGKSAPSPSIAETKPSPKAEQKMAAAPAEAPSPSSVRPEQASPSAKIATKKPVASKGEEKAARSTETSGAAAPPNRPQARSKEVPPPKTAVEEALPNPEASLADLRRSAVQPQSGSAKAPAAQEPSPEAVEAAKGNAAAQRPPSTQSKGASAGPETPKEKPKGKDVRSLEVHEADLRYQEGLIAQRAGDHQRAEAFYQKALAVDPAHVRALNNLGVIYMGQKKREKAVELFARAVVLKKDYVDPYYNLACLYAQMNQPGESLRYLKMASAIDPDVINWVKEDADLKNIVSSPEFQRIAKEKRN